MKAAVISEIGNTPLVAEFRNPPPAAGVKVGHLLAASLNPVDLTIAAGMMPHRPVEPPFIAGFEGVAQLDSGQVVYLAGPPQPFGTLAELIPVPDDHAIPVPDGLDPVLASSLGVAGLAAWLSLDYRGGLQPGESVLILGAGTVGLIAVQAAKAMGAERVVIADVRTEALQTAARKGADAAINLTGLDTGAMREAFASAAPQGFDLVLDLVWGDAVNAAIDAAKMHARVVQTGNAASPTVQLPAAVFRNKHISIIGQSVFVAPIEVRRTAYTALAQAALDGAISLDTTSAHLDEAGAAWRRLAEGAPEKQIVVP
jgi:NADPH2:quinone reductase